MPRAEEISLTHYYFGPGVIESKSPKDFVSKEAWNNYKKNFHQCLIKDYYYFDYSEIDEELDLNQKTFSFKNDLFPTPAPEEVATLLGVALEEEGKVLSCEFCRFLGEKFKDDLFSTEKEILSNVEDKYKIIFQTNQWYQTDYVFEELPSQSKTFKRISEILISGKVDMTGLEKPNNDWRNYPEAGGL